PGSDPVLKNEFVVFSAHMDHIGVAGPRGSGGCRAQGADSICNGGDDDGSGTVAVVEIAEALAGMTPRPKRSIIFLNVSGEEKGLWGSAYFSDHPAVPISNIVADLNIDMIGRNWKDTIVAIGKEHSDLGATLNRVGAAHAELNMRPIDDVWPAENFYFRSDHHNFARKGAAVRALAGGAGGPANCAAPGSARSVCAASAMVRPPRCVGTVATPRKLSGESSCTNVIVPSPLALTAKPRLGSNAAPSTPLPIGNVTSTLPRSGSTTAINPLEHTENRRRVRRSIASPDGSSHGASGQRPSTASVFGSNATSSLLSSILTYM